MRDCRFATSHAPSALCESNRVQILNPLGKNAKGPGWGLSNFGGEGGENLTSKEIRRSLKLFYYLALRELPALG